MGFYRRIDKQDWEQSPIGSRRDFRVHNRARAGFLLNSPFWIKVGVSRPTSQTREIAAFRLEIDRYAIKNPPPGSAGLC